MPCHTGLLGNEQADRMAKSAASALLIIDVIMKKFHLQREIGRKTKEKIIEANLRYYR